MTQGERERFNTWAVRATRARDGKCRRCGCEQRLECAHVFRLGMGGSRRDPRNWRNYPPARVMLCYWCHVAIDYNVADWQWSDIIHVAEAEREAVAMAVEFLERDVRPWKG